MSFLLFRSHPFLIALILLTRFVWPLKINKYLKVLLGIFFITISLKLYIYLLSGGTIMDPQLNRTLSIISNSLNFSALFLALLTICRDLINIFYKILKKRKTACLIAPHSLICAFMLALLSFSLGSVGTYNAFKAPQITDYTLTLNNLPHEADGYKLLFLTDLHISSPISKSDVEDIVALTNQEDADLIVITGDLVDGSVERLKDRTDILFKLKARDGIYAVSGNHEFYSGYEAWLKYFSKGGFKFLENKAVIIKDEKQRPLFNLSGVSDKNSREINNITSDLKQALANTDKNLPTILLSHQPAFAYEAQGQVDLILSGHTHGGQAPLIKNLVASANKGLVSGLYKLKSTQVLVSNGTKLWMGFPLRLNTPAEIIKITLKAK